MNGKRSRAIFWESSGRGGTGPLPEILQGIRPRGTQRQPEGPKGDASDQGGAQLDGADQGHRPGEGAGS